MCYHRELRPLLETLRKGARNLSQSLLLKFGDFETFYDKELTWNDFQLVISHFYSLNDYSEKLC